MDIYLTYRGKIPAKRSDLQAVWSMRKSFHSQLSRLWGKDPFSILDEEPYRRQRRTFRDQTFISFYGEATQINIRCGIKLLTGVPPQKPVIEHGDLDNRIKRIIDALRAPTQTGELCDELPPNSTWYTLVDDDSSVVEVNASLAPYLDSTSDAESFAFIKASTAPKRVTMDNLGLLL